MNLLRWLAGISWLVMLVATQVSVAVALLVLAGCAIVALLPRNRAKVSSRQLGVAAAALVALMGSFSVQLIANSVDSKIARELDFASHRVLVEILDTSSPVAHGRLIEVDAKPMDCAAPFGGFKCSPRIELRFGTSNKTYGNAATAPSKSKLSYPVTAGALLVADAFIKPEVSGKRYGFIATLGNVRVLASGGWWQSGIQLLHDRFGSLQRGLSTQADALVAGMAIGDISKLSNSTKVTMQTTGLTHLTAVSGANCVIVGAIVMWLVGRTRLGRAWRTALVLLSLTGYVALVGQQPSVLRAAFMFAVVAVAAHFGKSQQTLDALSAATLLLLFFDPWLSADLGFALSALATLGLLVAQTPIEQRLVRASRGALPAWLTSGVAVVLAAQLLCLPIILYLSNAVPVYTVVANLAAEPLVPTITVLGLVAVMTAGVAPPLAVALNWLASIPATWIIFTSRMLSSAPMARLAWPTGLPGVLLLAASGLRRLQCLSRGASGEPGLLHSPSPCPWVWPSGWRGRSRA